MSESTLSVKMTDLQGEIGDYLGWGRGVDNGEEEWTDQKLRTINRRLDDSLRWVYHEATLDPRMPPHEWTWLKPATNVTIQAGQKTVSLPDDFGSWACNKLSVTQGDSGGVHSRVALVGEPYLDEYYSQSTDITGRPLYAADRTLRVITATEGTRHELYVYPIPDAAYTFRGQYNLLGRALTSAAPYPYGGAAMASCFVAAARASAEIYLDNLRPGEGGEWMIFQRSLAAAIARDGRNNPKTLGINSDLSDPTRRQFPGRGWWDSGMIGFVGPLTIEGVEYD